MEQVHCVHPGCPFVTSDLEALLRHQNETGHNR